MTAEEVTAITVARRPRCAPGRHGSPCGAAVVTGVASPAECAELEQEFAADLAELVDQTAAIRAGTVISRAASACVADPHTFPEASLGLLAADARGLLGAAAHAAYRTAASPGMRGFFRALVSATRPCTGPRTWSLASTTLSSLRTPPRRLERAPSRRASRGPSVWRACDRSLRLCSEKVLCAEPTALRAKPCVDVVDVILSRML